MGDKAKALGCVPPTALLSVALQSLSLRIGFFALALIDGQAGVSDFCHRSALAILPQNAYLLCVFQSRGIECR
jgi:hypothetical protein